MVKSKTHMPVSTDISFQTEPIPNPLSITFLTIKKYQREGTKLANTCMATGMFSIGNKKPVSSIVGNIIPISDALMAACCVCALIDSNKPTDSDVMMNRIVQKVSNTTLPIKT